ncbi:response regulator [Chitinophaga ginsengisoli]|uniref:Response regulator receiver domain-containing protein n=1 Tax=Chitinophaga ginsengisoli TaxID=363837 RepID=A0A2P8G0K0_9BACT|nr:response regulator [Chitinophaga ginsengisoli]PSL27500.1 response regulator receiver domain-containing protein [Chitinophaga ginsengisoli]
MQEKIICFLIDDDHDDQEIFSLALNAIDEEIDCITANDGVDAINRLRRDRGFTPDFIFLDLNMLRMSGRECLKEIKKIPHLNDIPVIIYSTSSEQKDITETMLLGASDYIVKPPSISILTKRLEQVLRKE